MREPFSHYANDTFRGFGPPDLMIGDAKSDACQTLGAFINHHYALQRMNGHVIHQRSRTIGRSKSDYCSVITCFSITGQGLVQMKDEGWRCARHTTTSHLTTRLLAHYSAPISYPRKACTFGYIHVNSKYHSFRNPSRMPRRSHIGLFKISYEVAMAKERRNRLVTNR